MSSSETFVRGQLLPAVVILILTVFQLARVCFFANVFGGIENDGGWALNVSRSLAERGTYTTLVSTIVDPAVAQGINVDGKYDVQDEDGRIWFRTTSNIGPASILPDASILKVFGFGFWALRAGTLAFYALFLILAACTVYRLAGLGAVFLFHAFLFFYPRLSIFLSYEALGEMPALAYTMATLVLFVTVTGRRQGSPLCFLAVGLLAGLAVNAKLLALLSLVGLFAWAVVLWVWGQLDRSRNSVPLRLSEMVLMGVGFLLVPVVWELVLFLSMSGLVGREGYQHHLQQRREVMLDEGSGLRDQLYSGMDFVWHKLTLLREISHPQPVLAVIIISITLVATLVLCWLWIRRTREVKNRQYSRKLNQLVPIWLGALANVAWFVGMAKTGWPRHDWFGLMLIVLLLSSVPIALIREAWVRLQVPGARQAGLSSSISLAIVGVLVLVLVAWSFALQPHVWGLRLPDEIVPYWLSHRFDYVDDVGLPWIVIPRKDQAQVVDYIQHMPPEANVYYPADHKAAEIPPQTGRIHYPLARRYQPGVNRHPEDIILVSPSVISEWRYSPEIRRELLAQVDLACPNPMIKNDFYVICLADEVHLP